MKIKNSIILITSCFMFYAASADQSNHVGSRIMSKDEVIDKLKPQEATRGIRINQPEQAAPTISMEINFEFNSDLLTEQAIAQLTPIGEALQSNELAGLAFHLEGHTDAVGSEEYNLNLSQRRAQAVGNFLYQNYGVDPASLQLSGKGEYALLDQNNPASAVNRRVAITTITP